MEFIAAALSLILLVGCVSEYGQMVSQRPISISARQVNEVKSQVVYRLIDPQSAMFRELRAKEMSFDSGSKIVQVCGQVNSRNRMGGFAGFSWFHGEFDPSGKFTLRNIDGIDGSYSAMACG